MSDILSFHDQVHKLPISTAFNKPHQAYFPCLPFLKSCLWDLQSPFYRDKAKPMWNSISSGSWHGSIKQGNSSWAFQSYSSAKSAIPKRACLAGLLHNDTIWNPDKQSATRLMMQGFQDTRLKGRTKKWTILTLIPQEFTSIPSQILLNGNPTALKMLQRKHSRLKKVTFFWTHPVSSVYL